MTLQSPVPALQLRHCGHAETLQQTPSTHPPAVPHSSDVEQVAPGPLLSGSGGNGAPSWMLAATAPLPTTMSPVTPLARMTLPASRASTRKWILPAVTPGV